MGTDIHMAAEVRNDEGEWVFVPGPIIDCWACDGTGLKSLWSEGRRVQQQTNEPCGWCTNDGTTPEHEDDDGSYYRERYVQPGKTRDHWYSERNYTVFAVLGNVRNGHGFAGVYTHDPLPFITDCRGIPDDVTPETFQVLSDEHSGTWCTLQEVMEFDWKLPMHRSGVISLEQYERCRLTGGRPIGGWSGGISGPGVVTVTTQAADVLLAQQPLGALTAGGDVKSPADGGTVIGGSRYYVQYSWDDTLEDYTAHFLDRMKMLAMQAGEHECRLIMDFDS